MRTRVLIVGGGPVGLTLAMDLAWRGIDVVVAERRPPNDPPNVKCGQIGARSMEIFRRLGLADKLRGIGLPADYPNDIVSATSVTALSSPAYPFRRGGPAARLPLLGRTRSGRRPSTRIAAIRSSSNRCLPLAVLDVRPRKSRRGAYRHKLVLVRPDQHVAWPPQVLLQQHSPDRRWGEERVHAVLDERIEDGARVEAGLVRGLDERRRPRRSLAG